MSVFFVKNLRRKQVPAGRHPPPSPQRQTYALSLVNNIWLPIGLNSCFNLHQNYLKLRRWGDTVFPLGGRGGDFFFLTIIMHKDIILTHLLVCGPPFGFSPSLPLANWWHHVKLMHYRSGSASFGWVMLLNMPAHAFRAAERKEARLYDSGVRHNNILLDSKSKSLSAFPTAMQSWEGQTWRTRKLGLDFSQSLIREMRFGCHKQPQARGCRSTPLLSTILTSH